MSNETRRNLYEPQHDRSSARENCSNIEEKLEVACSIVSAEASTGAYVTESTGFVRSQEREAVAVSRGNATALPEAKE